ncbi:unnamed protein product [Parnassius apollo]|uniref:(apollo) hypothetical protein n=1 Tax=Parnassius apollo TaxID=110799 RepID=A0A8S3YAD6_PARAO|nr:unnamed protein product [Parnassius apollo]
MNVRRSPPGKSNSYTNLSSPNNEFTMEQQITHRKRKQPEHSICNCNCSSEIQELRKDLTTMLQKFTDTQETTMTLMRENIVDMRTQLNDIKEAAVNLNNEQKLMKTQLSDLVIKTNYTDNKIQTLMTEIKQINNKTNANESEIMLIKSKTAINLHSSGLGENIMQEIQDRTSRERNIIIVGLQEGNVTNTPGAFEETIRANKISYL